MKIGILCGREYSFPPAFIAKVNELGAERRHHRRIRETRRHENGRARAIYKVIVDRISHEVEYYRGYLKHAVLQGTYVINNPFWWTADDKFFNYSVAAKLGVAIPKTVLLPQKGYPADVDINSESLRNLKYPIDWDALLDYVGRPAILKPYSGGGWKHVYKVHNEKSCCSLRRTGAVLHDPAGVHRLRHNMSAASRSAKRILSLSPTIRRSAAIWSNIITFRPNWARVS